MNEWSIDPMMTTFLNFRYLFRGLILLLVSLFVSACASPTTQPTSALTPTGSGITAITLTRTPTSEWKTYQNTGYGFQFRYPGQGQLLEGVDERSGRIDLPYTEGTNLQEKYVQIDIQEDTVECNSPLSQGYAAEALQRNQMTINGMDFQITAGEEGAAGNIYDWTAYSATRNGTCVSISFILHATNPFNYPTPPPEFNRAAETEVFMEIISTFTWTK